MVSALFPALIILAASVAYYAILIIAWLIVRITRCGRWLLRGNR